MGAARKVKPIIGWREWIRFPDLGTTRVKAKVDTGARTSALHAFDIELLERRAGTLVRFKVHPFQRDSKKTIVVEAPLVEMRRVRASSGHASLRPVVRLDITLLEETWPIELTLASRDAMGFRMLLGRQAIRGHFTVDPGRSYIGGKFKRRRVKKARKAKRGPR